MGKWNAQNIVQIVVAFVADKLHLPVECVACG